MKDVSRCLPPLLLVATLSQGDAAPGASAKITLRPSYGGAVVQGKVYTPKADTLVNVWSSKGRARLLQCRPICKVVTSIPVKGTVVIGASTGYRIALGGQYRVGQKASVSLRFQNAGVMVVTATITRS